jgi:hypothetical protein
MKKTRLSIALASLLALGGTLTHSSLDVFANSINSSAYSNMENSIPDSRQLAGLRMFLIQTCTMKRLNFFPQNKSFRVFQMDSLNQIIR